MCACHSCVDTYIVLGIGDVHIVVLYSVTNLSCAVMSHSFILFLTCRFSGNECKNKVYIYIVGLTSAKEVTCLNQRPLVILECL